MKNIGEEKEEAAVLFSAGRRGRHWVNSVLTCGPQVAFHKYN